MPLSEKHSDTKTYDALYNAGPPASQLAKDFITPTALFFVRNHAEIPQVALDSYRLRVEGRVAKALSLGIDDLRSGFEKHSLPATLQCAGNRRRELLRHKPIDDQLDWGIEAIGTAEWAGARLRDVLQAAGVQGDSAKHAAFLGLDAVQHAGEQAPYGSSIPLDKALAGEVLLAYEMNGEPLTLAHGSPLRVVVPGYIGARSIKWLSKIIVQDEPSSNYFQQVAYKLFPPSVNAHNVNYDDGQPLSRLPVNSVIVRPADGSRLPAGRIAVEGYAMGDGEHPIVRVAVSADGGAAWQRAEFLNAPQLWSWQLWRAVFDLPPGEHELVVRAWDSAGSSQPEAIASVWNFKGYVNNAWHRIQITTE